LIRILDYGDEQTFSDLWLKGLSSESASIAGQEFSWSPAGLTVLIIGEQPPHEVFRNLPDCLRGINCRDHLTALSWAAAWRLNHPDSPVRLGVIGVDCKGDSSSTPAVLATLFTAQGASSRPFVPRLAYFHRPELSALAAWLTLEEPKGENEVSPTLPLLQSCIMEGLTAKREQHHAISNVLGAFLLGVQLQGPRPHAQPPTVQDYLAGLIRSVGLDPGSADDMVRGQSWISDKHRSDLEAAVLLDDMSDLWADFLRGALGFTGGQSQRLVTAPRAKFFEEIQGLPDRLTAFLAANRNFLTAETLFPGQHEVGDRFVLFLDLRLFPDPEAGSSSDEAKKLKDKFFRQLAQFGSDLLGSGRNLPWLEADGQARLKSEFQSLVAPPTSGIIPGSKRPISGVPPEETLLPRLLSLLDPTLPIIIFSSTHRTELIAPFRDYANIFTGFRKPVLTGLNRDWGETVNECRAAFAACIERAARVIRARTLFQTLERKALVDPNIQQAHLPPSQHGHLVEVFLDESLNDSARPRSVCSGGIVVVRALGVDGEPVVKDEKIFDDLAALGCIWGWCSDTPNDFRRPQNTALARGFMPKGERLGFVGNQRGPGLLESMVDGAQSVLRDHGQVFPVAAIDDRSQVCPVWMEPPTQALEWEVEKMLDATLRRLVQHLIEGLLFRCGALRETLNNPKSRIAIDIGTRDYPCQPSDARDALIKRFGFEVSRRDNRASFHGEDGFKITSETLARTGIVWPYKAGVVRARAVQLNDFEGDRPQVGLLPKQLHYFADTIAHVVLHDLVEATTKSPPFSRFIASGWMADLRNNPEESDRLEIGRAWDQNDRVEALVWAGKLQQRTPRNGIGIDVFRELNQGARRLSGSELGQLFSRLQDSKR